MDNLMTQPMLSREGYVFFNWKKKTPKIHWEIERRHILGVEEKHEMGVSKNNGTPKSSILIGFSIINHPFLGFSPYKYFWFNIQIETCESEKTGWGIKKKINRDQKKN